MGFAVGLRAEGAVASLAPFHGGCFLNPRVLKKGMRECIVGTRNPKP